MNRRITALSLAALLLAGAFLPRALRADTADKPEHFIYGINSTGDGVVINGLRDKNFYGAVNIPAEIEGFPVIGIGVRAFEGVEFESINIPGSVLAIGPQAFRRTNFVSFTVPDSVLLLGDGVFARCEWLETVTLPKNIKSLPAQLFYGCTSLAAFTVPDSITEMGKGVFANCTALASVRLSRNLAIIPSETFTGCTALTTISIPASVTEIRENAFKNTGLTALTIPGTVQSIGDGAFSGSALATLVVAEGTAEIRAEAFASCKKLREVTLPRSIRTIGQEAFAHCTELTTLRMIIHPVSYYNNITGWEPFRNCPKLDLESQSILQKTGYGRR